MTSLTTMETDANNFREHVNSSSANHDQELLDLAVVYEVDILFTTTCGGVGYAVSLSCLCIISVTVDLLRLKYVLLWLGNFSYYEKGDCQIYGLICM
jgi:hypothetical protein